MINPAGTFPTYAQKRRRTYVKRRKGYTTVARTRGWAAVPGEMKYFDSARSSIPIPASVDWTATEFPPNQTAPVNTCFAPVKGAGINERIGRSVNVHKIKIRGSIFVPAQINQVASDAASQIRLLLVQDTQTNATQAQGEEIMMAPLAATAYQSVNCFQSLASLGRFRTLKDRTFTVQQPPMAYDGTNMEQGGVIKPFKFTHTFKKPVKVTFNATNGGTIADIVDNSWSIYACANVAELVPNLSYLCRISYKE